MKNLLITISILMLILSSIKLKAQELETKVWNYIINIDFKDSTLFINLNLKAFKTAKRDKFFFLFNRYIKIDEVLLNDKSLNYTRNNDTLYFESSNSDEINISMHYKIPCSLSESSKIIKTFGDSIFAYPAQLDTNQIFCERYSKYYPFIYDNYSNYKVKITVPKDYKVYAEHRESENISLKDRNIYTFNFFDEDLRFFITKTNIFQLKKVIKTSKTNCKFYFLPRNKRLVSYANKIPKYITNLNQIDSLYNVIINRSAKALEWYNTNLWQQTIDTLPFVETWILGLATNMRSFILFDRSLMNMEVIDNYAFSHEIGHFWIGYNVKYSSKGYYFLSESINEFVNLVYYKSWAGSDAFNKAIENKTNLQYSNKDFFTVSFEKVLNQKNEDLKYEMIYCKGVVFAYKFFELIGKEKFLKIIRETYNKSDDYITLTDFENIVKKNGCWNEYIKLYDIKL